MQYRLILLIVVIITLVVFRTIRHENSTTAPKEFSQSISITADDVPTHANSVVATFSIVAADPETGICGAAVASKFPAVGKVVPIVRAGVGAFCTQHYCRTEWREQAMELLAKEKSPADVLATLLAKDDEPGERQLAIINRKGVTAVHNPTDAEKSSEYWGAMSGRFYSCQGNTLAGRDVIVSMAKAYEETKGSLADRMMAALVAGDCAGGDHRGRLAAGIRVAKTGVDGNWLELDIDESDDAVCELAQKYAELKHDAKGEWRGAKLPFDDSATPNLLKPRESKQVMLPHNIERALDLEVDQE